MLPEIYTFFLFTKLQSMFWVFILMHISQDEKKLALLLPMKYHSILAGNWLHVASESGNRWMVLCT